METKQRYYVLLEHFNDCTVSVLSRNSLSDCLHYIAKGIKDVTYPSDKDNVTDNLYCFRLFDNNKIEEDSEGNKMPAEILCTDYFYMN